MAGSNLTVKSHREDNAAVLLPLHQWKQLCKDQKKQMSEPAGPERILKQQLPSLAIRVAATQSVLTGDEMTFRFKQTVK